MKFFVNNNYAKGKMGKCTIKSHNKLWHNVIIMVTASVHFINVNIFSEQF